MIWLTVYFRYALENLRKLNFINMDWY